MTLRRHGPEKHEENDRKPFSSPAPQAASASSMSPERVIALQQSIGNHATQRVIDRKVVPTRSPEAEATVPSSDLQASYNSAWSYLWGSENSRKIYNYVDALPIDVPIEVGSTDSDAEAAKVRWNPREANLQLNAPNLPSEAAEGGPKIKAEQIVGQSSSAITLLHELGHVRQHQEAKQIDAKAGGTSGDLGELLRNVKALAKPYAQDQAKLNTPDVVLVEEDNVTRHERPAGEDLEEPTRAGYFYSGPNANPDLFAEGEQAGLIAELKSTAASLVSTMVSKGDDVHEAATVARTVKDYFKDVLADVAKAKPTGWKAAKHSELTTLLTGYITELEAQEQIWAATQADAGAAVPKWG